MALKEIIEHFQGKTATYEGGVGYHTSFKETLAEFFSLGLLNGKFYQTKEEVLEGALAVYAQALTECPEFATKCAVYGAEQNSLKLVPTFWLVFLSTLEEKTLFNKAFPRIIRSLNLLHDFMELCRKTPIRNGLGRSVKRTMNLRLQSLLNDYSVSRNKTVIGELVKVTRPYNKDETFQNYMKYVSKDELTFARVRELKRILEKLSRNEVDEDTLETITRYGFQLEELKHGINPGLPGAQARLFELSKQVVSEKDLEKVTALQAEIMALKEKETRAMPLEQKRDLYKHLYQGLRYAALMLNLVALERVFADEVRRVQKYSPARGRFWQDEVIRVSIPEDISALVSEKIRRVADYRGSNILPFTLINARRMVKTPAFQQAIEEILLVCAKEAFTIREDMDILVGVDTSGSMRSMINDSLSVIDAASLLGALLKSSHKKTTVCAVASQCKPVHLHDEPLFHMAERIAGTDVGSGTNLEQIMREYQGQKYLILLTDSVAADDLETRWLSAKKPPGATLIVWQLQAYQTKLSNHRSVIYFAGYSDRLLELLKRIIEETATQFEAIEAIAL